MFVFCLMDMRSGLLTACYSELSSAGLKQSLLTGSVHFLCRLRVITCLSVFYVHDVISFVYFYLVNRGR